MKSKILALMFCISFAGIAQVGIGTTSPDGSSALEIKATDKGFLLPRMTTVQKDAITTPATGLQVYDLDTKSVWTYDGAMWENGVGGAGKFIDGATPEIAYYEGSVGIGRNNFSTAVHKLWVEDKKDTENTNTTAKIIAAYEGTNTSTATYGLATEAQNNASGTVKSAAGLLGATVNGVNGKITNGFGSWNYIQNNGEIYYGAGTLGVVYGQKGKIELALGTVSGIENYATAHMDNAYVGDFYVSNEGTIDNLYGSYFEYYGSGTATNSYAIYVDATFNKGTAENYFIYSIPDIDSYIEGKTGFGVKKPQQKIHISGAMRLEPQVTAPSGGALGDLYVGTDNKLYFHNGTAWKEVLLAP